MSVYGYTDSPVRSQDESQVYSVMLMREYFFLRCCFEKVSSGFRCVFSSYISAISFYFYFLIFCWPIKVFSNYDWVRFLNTIL